MEEIKNTVVDEEFFDDFDEAFEEPKKKSFLDGVKEFSKKGLNKAKDGFTWCKEHPSEALEGVATIGGIAVAALIGVDTAKSINKAKRTVYSDDIKECVLLNKPLTNEEKVEVDFRVKNGQTKIEALNDMGKIKRKK